jgi:hypothetical protein
MRVGSGSRPVLDMLGPWKIVTAVLRWSMVLLLLPRHLPRIDLSVMNSLSTTKSTLPSSSYAPYSSSAVMVVDAEKVANPTDQFDIDDSYLRVTIRHQTFHEIPSCQHRITQIELHNLVPYQCPLISDKIYCAIIDNVSNNSFRCTSIFDVFDDSIPKKN